MDLGGIFSWLYQMMDFRSTGKTTTTNVHRVKYFLRHNALFPQPPLHCVLHCCFLNGLPSNGHWKPREQNVRLFTGSGVKEKSKRPRNEPYNLLQLRTEGRKRSSSPRAKWEPCHVTDHRRQREGWNTAKRWPSVSGTASREKNEYCMIRRSLTSLDFSEG